MIMIAVMILMPIGDPGKACTKTQMNGYPEGSLIAALTSVIAKRRTMRKTRPRRALMPKLHIIALGTARPASRVSSDMCAAQSEPIEYFNRSKLSTLDKSHALTNNPINGRDLANHETEPHTLPSSAVCKDCENFSGRIERCLCP